MERLDAVEQVKALQASKLRRLREEAGLTQGAVAEAMGVSQPMVAKWEQRNDPGDAWPRLAKVLGVGESYPSAPFEPVARRAFFEQRVLVPRRASYGTGVPPQS